MNKILIIVGVTVLMPFTAHAQGTLGDAISIVLLIVNTLIALALILALLFLIWGLTLFMLRAGDENERIKGRNLMIWGTIALFVAVSVWGLLAVLRNTFDLTEDAPRSAPTAPVPR